MLTDASSRTISLKLQRELEKEVEFQIEKLNK